jgi:hypothetical protein
VLYGKPSLTIILLHCTKKDEKDNNEKAALIIKTRCQKEFKEIRENTGAMRCLGGRL